MLLLCVLSLAVSRCSSFISPIFGMGSSRISNEKMNQPATNQSEIKLLRVFLINIFFGWAISIILKISKSSLSFAFLYTRISLHMNVFSSGNEFVIVKRVMWV